MRTDPIMNTEKMNQWLHFAGNIAILLGLIFVGFQLYQDRQLKSAELIDQVYQNDFQHRMVLLGESAAGAISKAAMSPNELKAAVSPGCEIRSLKCRYLVT